MALIPYIKLALTATGTSVGVLAVSSTAQLVVGARIWVGSNTAEPTELMIDQILDATHIVVSDLQVNFGRYNCTRFTPADQATLTQNEQPNYNALRLSDAGITVQDEGTETGEEQAVLNFVGSGVTVSSSGTTTTVTIPGGGGGSGTGNSYFPTGW